MVLVSCTRFKVLELLNWLAHARMRSRVKLVRLLAFEYPPYFTSQDVNALPKHDCLNLLVLNDFAHG